MLVSARKRYPLGNRIDTITHLSDATRRNGGAVLAAVALATAVLFLPIARGVAQSSNPETQWDYPLLGDDGQRASDHTIELPGPLDRLPGVVVVGNRSGKATVAEFYDLNCPYCRKAAADIGEMISRDRELRLLLVPYPVLGIASLRRPRRARRRQARHAGTVLCVHRKMYARRGTNDGARALDVAQSLGLDKRRLLALADSDQVTETMKTLVRLGTALACRQRRLSWSATRRSLVTRDRVRSRQSISAAATCGKVVC